MTDSELVKEYKKNGNPTFIIKRIMKSYKINYAEASIRIQDFIKWHEMTGNK